MPWRISRLHHRVSAPSPTYAYASWPRRHRRDASYRPSGPRSPTPPHLSSTDARDTTRSTDGGASKSSLTDETDTTSSDQAGQPPSSSTAPSSPLDTGVRDPTLGRLISTDFATLQAAYVVPRHPIVLAHGLMGFDELRFAGKYLPGIHYWRGITDAFAARGIACITTAVPTTGSIEERAHALQAQIAAKASGRRVNIVAHSMGGLDSRYLISRLRPGPDLFRVASLTTIGTPHRGSSAADMVFRDIGEDLMPRIYRALDRLKIDSGAFAQLTTRYITNQFNPATPDDPAVRYFSYGASATPSVFSVFRLSHDLMLEVEGANDGLVSVRSAQWGEYLGTLVGVTHLDLINWTNRLKRVAARSGLVEQKFNAVAFYLGVADMLAKQGL